MDKIKFEELLCTLEGYKTKFREFHWNAKLMSEHKLCDDVMGSITEFQDNIAEEGFVIFGKFESNTFVASQVSSNSVVESLTELITLIGETKIDVSEDLSLCSISAICDEFIHTFRKYIYLSQLQ